MIEEPITYISLNLGPDVGANDTIVGVRVVPDGRNGNEVYGRTLDSGEPDTGEGIILEAGDKLVFPPGSVKVTLQDVDRYADAELDGYAAVTNTVWTWLQIPPRPDDQAFFLYMLATSRRLDRAYALCVGALRELGQRADEPFISTRSRVFNALGNAESMCIALNRAIWMIRDAQARFPVKTAVPHEVADVQDAVRAIRNAFEHIDERAFGEARQETPAEAMSIFNQADLVTSRTIRYACHSLDMRMQVVPALVAARRFVYDVIAEAGITKTLNNSMEFGPFMDD